MPEAPLKSGLSAVPRGVWALGFVSMFMNISSEMNLSLLPVFLVVNLGASVALVGLIEGIAEATASITKIFSGWLSDRLGKRKLLAIIGYSLGALIKPMSPLAMTPFAVLSAVYRSRWQGHSRRTEGCFGRGHHAARNSRCSVRIAAIARHGRWVLSV